MSFKRLNIENIRFEWKTHKRNSFFGNKIILTFWVGQIFRIEVFRFQWWYQLMNKTNFLNIRTIFSLSTAVCFWSTLVREKETGLRKHLRSSIRSLGNDQSKIGRLFSIWISSWISVDSLFYVFLCVCVNCLRGLEDSQI